MYLIQILLPLYDNDGKDLARTLYQQVRTELVARFGGLTAYTRAPVSGLWQEGEGKTVHDDLVIYEVIVDTLDRSWWCTYRTELERRFDQEALIVRAQPMELL